MTTSAAKHESFTNAASISSHRLRYCPTIKTIFVQCLRVCLVSPLLNVISHRVICCLSNVGPLRCSAKPEGSICSLESKQILPFGFARQCDSFCPIGHTCYFPQPNHYKRLVQRWFNVSNVESPFNERFEYYIVYVQDKYPLIISWIV